MDTDLRKVADGGFCSLSDNRISFAERNHIAEKVVYFPIFFQPIPVQPGNLVILAICIVIAKLRITEFISGIKHRRTSAAH